MEIDFAFICDYADVSNKIHALGIGFDTIYARQTPVKHPIFFLVAQLKASVAEAGPKDIELRVIDADGADLIPPMKSKLDIPAGRGVTETHGRLCMAFNNLEFPRFGVYSIHLVIQGREMVRIPLRIAEAPPPGLGRRRLLSHPFLLTLPEMRARRFAARATKRPLRRRLLC